MIHSYDILHNNSNTGFPFSYRIEGIRMQKKPTYKLTPYIHEEFVKIVITGEVTRDDIKDLTNEVYKIVQLTNAKKLLCDVRGVKGRFGYTDMYLFATNVPSAFFNIPTALIDLPENEKLQSFRQYVAEHAGIPVKWCTNPEEAISWLQSMPNADG